MSNKRDKLFTSEGWSTAQDPCGQRDIELNEPKSSEPNPHSSTDRNKSPIRVHKERLREEIVAKLITNNHCLLYHRKREAS